MTKKTFKYILEVAISGTIVFSANYFFNEAKLERKNLYDKAFRYAEKTTGDRKSPMTESEMNEWYNVMNISKGEKPSKKDLENFINKMRHQIIIDDIKTNR